MKGLCEACQKGKSKKAPHKSTDTYAYNWTSSVNSYGLIWSSECDVNVKEEICSCTCRWLFLVYMGFIPSLQGWNSINGDWPSEVDWVRFQIYSQGNKVRQWYWIQECTVEWLLFWQRNKQTKLSPRERKNGVVERKNRTLIVLV